MRPNSRVTCIPPILLLTLSGISSAHASEKHYLSLSYETQDQGSWPVQVDGFGFSYSYDFSDSWSANVGFSEYGGDGDSHTHNSEQRIAGTSYSAMDWFLDMQFGFSETNEFQPRKENSRATRSKTQDQFLTLGAGIYQDWDSWLLNYGVDISIVKIEHHEVVRPSSEFPRYIDVEQTTPSLALQVNASYITNIQEMDLITSFGLNWRHTLSSDTTTEITGGRRRNSSQGNGQAEVEEPSSEQTLLAERAAAINRTRRSSPGDNSRLIQGITTGESIGMTTIGVSLYFTENQAISLNASSSFGTSNSTTSVGLDYSYTF